LDNRTNILIAEDAPEELEALSKILACNDYEVIETQTGKECLARVRDFTPHAIILDKKLPDIDGIEVYKQLKKFCKAPVMILSGFGEPKMQAAAFNAGIADYMVKPYHSEELLARLNHLLREHKKDLYQISLNSGRVTIDLESRTIMKCGKIISFTKIQFNILEYLALNAGIANRYKEIFIYAWGKNVTFNLNSLRVKINEIRKEIEDNPSKPDFIKTLSGFGYRFDKK
jgi:two-component system, OmpR family, KDP operon response regulator KdpE